MNGHDIRNGGSEGALKREKKPRGEEEAKVLRGKRARYPAPPSKKKPCMVPSEVKIKIKGCLIAT